ncbi:MAG: carboxypeptidase-like regulatory domain-containing protein, partial [Bacteroidetes bacterium]|nr:carboxypeptidase-like regulatory domain-containing protein [Bacteroidota bacterium]
MKKNLVKHSPQRRALIKYIMMMKAVWILVMASVLQVTAGNTESYSQNTKLNLKLKDASLEEVIWGIRKQTEFNFFYNTEDVKEVNGLNLNYKDATAQEILTKCLAGTGLTFEIVNKAVIIKEKDKPIHGITTVVLEQPRKKQLEGKVTDAKGDPIPGTTVIVKGTTIGTITNGDGEFVLNVPLDSKILSFSFVGYKSQEIPIGNKTTFNIVLEEMTVGLEEVVAVGYGVQKKASVVGAITTTTGKELERVGGVTNLTQALTGQLPGLTTIQTTGQPGNADPKIYIRGQSTWNGGEPLILVDGVERRMNDLDMSEVDNISVLKDASATAVYGV